MESLEHINLALQIIAAVATITLGVFGTVVQIRKLPAGWYVAPLTWIGVFAPMVLSLLGSGALAYNQPKLAAVIWLGALLINVVSFCSQKSPITRTSIAMFVVFTAGMVSAIMAVILVDLIARVLDLVGQSIDVLDRLTTQPPIKGEN